MSVSVLSAIAVIPAAGTGQRMAADKPKQYLNCLSKPLIWHSLNRFQVCPWISKIYVSLAEDDPYWVEMIGDQFDKVTTVSGGVSRAESVFNSLKRAKQSHSDDTWTLVHDAARPCLTTHDMQMIKERCILDQSRGFILADKINDTVKQSNADNCIAATIDRSTLWRALTPQVFKLGDLHQALASVDLERITDEASAMENFGVSVGLLQGDATNIKVTKPADLVLAELYLQQQECEDY